MLKWYNPRQLESFLMPNFINWTLPVTEFTATGEALTSKYSLVGRNTNDIMAPLYIDRKVVLRGNEEPQVALQRAAFKSNTFGAIWHLFFRPSARVQEALITTFHNLKLTPGEYTAMHLRVRHPANYAGGNDRLVGNQHIYMADSSGLPWTGQNKDYAVRTAIRAIECSRILSNRSDEPLYILSDSDDLVNYMVHGANGHLAKDTIANLTELDRSAREVVSQVRLVSRDLNVVTAHLEQMYHSDDIGGTNYTWESFASGFIDLYIGVHARCMVFGVGNFAHLATQISGTNCQMRHQFQDVAVAKKWGSKDNLAVPLCPLAKT